MRSRGIGSAGNPAWKPGFPADRIATVTTTNPLEDIRALLQVTFVMKGGVSCKNEQQVRSTGDPIGNDNIPSTWPQTMTMEL